MLDSRPASSAYAPASRSETPLTQIPVEERPGDRFRRAVEAGEFLVTAEVMPPKGGDPTHMLTMAQQLQGRVHGVNITDGSRAVLRMSSLVAAALLLQQGIEPIYQVACRDRNRIALQADLMGAQALGIRNVLALTGDPVKAGDHPQAKSVFDLESVRLLKLIGQLNQGVDDNGKPLSDGATTLFAGAAIDPQCRSWSGLQRRFERKLEAGAQFFQSQLISDFDRLEAFMSQVAAGCGKPVLAGIFLLKSAKNARFINRCVPGVQIPEATIERLEQAPNPLEEGMRIAAEQVQAAQQICQGVHMMAVRREDLIPQILDLAGVSPVLSGEVTVERPAQLALSLPVG
ncbi:MAG: methylenetetrahydrofolate reductase [Elainellaceae cyanobacterium]